MSPPDLSPEAHDLLRWLSEPKHYGYLYPRKKAETIRLRGGKTERLPAVDPKIQRRVETDMLSVFQPAGMAASDEERRPWRELAVLGLTSTEDSVIRITDAGRRFLGA